MSARVVVLGAGYAGAGAVTQLESVLDGGEVVWISERDYHFVLHESHRIIRDPDAADPLTIPVERIKSPETGFLEGTVVGVDTDRREVELAGGESVTYDYLLVALGSETAFYGIPGLAQHALTLKGRSDALAIHEAVADAARTATRNDPAQVVVGGAGLSGVQSAGEIAAFRDERRAPIDVHLIEALDEVLPGLDPGLQSRVRRFLADADVEILTGDPIVEADGDRIYFDRSDPLEYDVLVWTGGITGRDAVDDSGIEADHDRLLADATFRTSDERVFAIGDAAVIDQDGDLAPPTAQAAWQAATVAAENVARAVRGDSLASWTYADMGTLVSVGDRAVAHDVSLSPVSTFDSLPARFLKKFVAARWIAGVTSWRRALGAWEFL